MAARREIKTRSTDVAGIRLAANVVFYTSQMRLQSQRRDLADTLLLSIWVFGYGALIRCFAALQRVERSFSGSKQVDRR
jgi:hypothetical protein